MVASSLIALSSIQNLVFLRMMRNAMMISAGTGREGRRDEPDRHHAVEPHRARRIRRPAGRP